MPTEPVSAPVAAPVDPRGLSVLFLAPMFLSYRLHRLVRGVEVFDLELVRELVELGVRVTLPAHWSWRRRLHEHLAGALPRLCFMPGLRRSWLTTLAAAVLLRRERHDVLYLGNAARSLMPGARIMGRRGMYERVVVMSHRVPRPSVARALERLNPAHILAVSEEVRGGYPPSLRERVHVHFGLVGATGCFPREEPRPPGDPIRFCLIGKLDSAPKGADLALAGFARLAPEVRARSELHLISYPGKPPREACGPGMVHSPWMPAAEVPAFLRRMDVMLVPSRSETFSQVMVQGMLTGLPIVAYDLPVLVEKLDTGGGIVVRTPEEMAAAMTRLALDADVRTRIGAIARETALARYVWSTPTFVNRFLATP